MRSLDYHLTTCEFAHICCPNECTASILRRDEKNHLKKCPNRQHQCPKCDATGRYCDITTTHLDTCPKAVIFCSNEGCEKEVLRCNLLEHLKTCDFTLLHCPNKCIENKKEPWILHCDLKKHLKHCPNRQHQCRHCETIGRYCDITTTHLETCPKVKIPCPNTDCKASVPRCDLSIHRSTCEFEKVPCKYAGIGCEEEPLRRDLEQHVKEDAVLHLHFAIQTINKQQEEIDKQRKEIDELREEMKESRKSRKS